MKSQSFTAVYGIDEEVMIVIDDLEKALRWNRYIFIFHIYVQK